MDFEQMYDTCVTVFNKGAAYTSASVTDLTRQGEDIVIVKQNNKTVAITHDTFEGVALFLYHEPLDTDNMLVIPEDSDIMAEEDEQRRIYNKYNYPHLERLYGR